MISITLATATSFSNIEALARGTHALSRAVEEAPEFGLQPVLSHVDK